MQKRHLALLVFFLFFLIPTVAVLLSSNRQEEKQKSKRRKIINLHYTINITVNTVKLNKYAQSSNPIS